MDKFCICFEGWNWKSHPDYVGGARPWIPTDWEKCVVQINWKGVHGINILLRERKRLIMKPFIQSYHLFMTKLFVIKRDIWSNTCRGLTHDKKNVFMRKVTNNSMLSRIHSTALRVVRRGWGPCGGRKGLPGGGELRSGPKNEQCLENWTGSQGPLQDENLSWVKVYRSHASHALGTRKKQASWSGGSL